MAIKFERFREGDPIAFSVDKFVGMFACAQRFDFRFDIFRGALCCPLGGFGFHARDHCLHDPTRHPATTATATAKEVRITFHARFQQEAQGLGAVRTQHLSEPVDLAQCSLRYPDTDHRRASGARATTFATPFGHGFCVNRKSAESRPSPTAAARLYLSVDAHSIQLGAGDLAGVAFVVKAIARTARSAGKVALGSD